MGHYVRRGGRRAIVGQQRADDVVAMSGREIDAGIEMATTEFWPRLLFAAKVSRRDRDWT